MNSRTRKIVINSVGCLLFLSIPILTSPDFNFNLSFFKVNAFQKSFLNYILLLLFFFVNYNYLIPKFFVTNKKTIYVVLIILCFAGISFLPNLLFPNFGFHSIPPNGFDKFPKPENHNNHFIELLSLIPFLMIIALSFLLKMNAKLDKIKSEKLKAEVSYLKAQINPHFLFNTLNSLYALTLEKSDDAPNAVLKLSNMMRYVVTESATDFVSLEKEINHIKDYIDLQKLRIDDQANLRIVIEGNLYGKVIAPLILIPFIENAFKYGINPDENSFIEIVITIKNDDFKMIVKNSIVNISIPEELKSEKGLENTTKRLEYIYPNRHVLKISENNATFEVNLKINLG
ncbi:histidine kinase [Flavobacterium sp. SUN052]|uniref:sensor histidine kinase n=1 Tax=Flavobacterium sp. SUN052 TaxID=3002441 RepID=UPI00237D8AED|nr:histidine kinase [Flavobacterium sp. SUN052]MEC4004031.1 histidine kinase [Flavobacterium sp. SUN052]